MAKERWCGYGVGCISVASGRRMKRLSRRSARRVATNSVKRSASRSRLPAHDACRTRCLPWRMRAAQTVEEREQLRLEHHARMQARAKEQGWTCRICR